MTKQRILPLILFLGLASSPIYAGGDSEGRGHGDYKRGGPMMHRLEDPERMLSRLGHWLELDDLQRQQLDNLALSIKPEMADLRERARSVHDALRSIDPADDDYANRVHELAAASGQVATEMTLMAARMRAELHTILTPEQRQQLDEGRQRMRQQFKESRD